MRQRDLHRGDLDARTRAATTFDRPITVEAGAGTGKTTLLIHRLLVWVLDVGWTRTASHVAGSSATVDRPAAEPERVASRLLDRIVAITFTEAAAAELADRFVAAIADAAHGDLPLGFEQEWLTVDAETLADRARWLLPQVDRAHITTIHAWCYELLRRHPYEAGVHPELEIVADAQEIESVAREVVEAHYRRAYQRGYDTDLVLLGEEKLGPRDWVEIVRQWVVSGWDVATHLPDEDGLADAVDSIRRSAAELQAVAPAELAEARRSPTTLAALDAAAATARLDAVDPGTCFRQVIDLWPENLRKRIAEWSRGEYNKTEAAALGDARAELSTAAGVLAAFLSVLKQIDPERWSRRQRVLEAAILDTEAALKDNSAITFGGLLRQASRLLAGNQAVAAAERERVDLLLVDEFQDTDALQAKLVTALALTVDAGPSLIVVGDPKQSIYGWRNADLETYEHTRRQVVDRGGFELILSSNFRSTTAVLATTDGIVGSQMQADPGFQPEYHGLTAAAEHASTSPAPVELLRFVADSAAEQARREAEWVARDLAERGRGGELTWDQAAILMRSKTHVRAVLRALRAEGIPYEMSADVGFHERSEVIDAAAWVRVVADPEDQVALLKVLRSPTVGVPDAALAAAWKPLFERIRVLARPDENAAGEIHRILEHALDGVSGVPGIDRIGGWVDHATDRLEHIGRLRSELRRKPFGEFIDRLRRATDIEAIEARRPEGGARVANLVKLFDQLIQQVEETGGDTHAVLRVLRRGIYFELPAEEAVPLKPLDGAVQVATIHAAKGLEFDHLYLVHFGMGGGRDDTDLQVEAAVPGATLIKGVAHPQWALGQQRRKRVGDAEALRLLYVALTRARRRLAICLPERSNAGTLGRLIDDGLAAAGRATFDGAITERTAAVVEDSTPQGKIDFEPAALPNPAWAAPPDPGPLHDSPTRARAGAAAIVGKPASRGGRDRGSVVHDLLAGVDLSVAEPALPGSFVDREFAPEFWAAFPATDLGRRLLSLGDRLRGREVEVLTPAELLGRDSNAAYAAGKIDLLYVEDGGEWVVADYKTGKPEDVPAEVNRYAPQLRYYGHALTEALELDQPPRLELWFVDLDRIEVVASSR